jgi:hypothetical protein
MTPGSRVVARLIDPVLLQASTTWAGRFFRRSLRLTSSTVADVT